MSNATFVRPLAAILAAVALAGCGLFGQPQPEAGGPAPTAEATATPPPPPTATPLPRGGNLTVRIAQDIPDLRPWQPRSRAEEQVIGALYSGLMRLDEGLRPQPDLAESVSVTPDGRVITFTLRTGLTWHDGDPLDAADVVFTLTQLRQLPPTTTALLADLRYIAGISAPTATTVAISLTERYGPLLAELSLPILPQHLLAGRDLGTLNFWEVPIGSGPFRVGQLTPGQSIVLERFDGFHRGAPLLDRVAFVVAPDEAVARAALAEGQLLLAELPWGAASAISGTIPGLRLGAYPENGYYFLGFNLREGRPFADPAVRGALAQAIDLDRLVEAATKGQGIPIGSSASPGSWADLTPPAPGGDLDGARATLEAAGWTLPPGGTIRQQGGAPLAGELFVRGDDERRVVAARRVAEVAATIGISLTVQPADFQTVILAKYAPPFSFDVLLGSWVNGAGDPAFGDYAFYDPDDFALFHSSQINQGESDTRVTRNFVAFADPEYDSQAQAARQLYDPAERASALAAAQARIAAARPYLYLWADRLPVALSERVETLDGPVNLSSPAYMWNIERWYLRP